jgi:purine-binding chemotaxis protein CheW
MNAMLKPSGSQSTRWLAVRVAGADYAINLAAVREVLRVPDIAPVPGAPSGVLGVMNLRGDVVSVLDARARLALPIGQRDERCRVVLVENDGLAFGVLVDSVGEIVEFEPSACEPQPLRSATDGAPQTLALHVNDGGTFRYIGLQELLGPNWRAFKSGHPTCRT